MFILRSIDTKYGEFNTCLGDYYTLLYKEQHSEEFNEAVKLWDKEVVDTLYGIVVFENGLYKREDLYTDSIMPLYIGKQYYIMTGDGRTFSNISEK